MIHCFRISLCIVLIGAFSSFSLPPQQALSKMPKLKGKVFQFTNGGFKAYFPEYPLESREVLETDLGKSEMVAYTYAYPNASVALMVVYNDFVSSDDPSEILEGGRNGVLRGLGVSSVEMEKSVTLQNVEGIHFSAKNEEYFAEYYVYYEGKRLYQIAIVSAGDSVNKKEAKKFFKSFKFI